jgi:hypothetical protein
MPVADALGPLTVGLGHWPCWALRYAESAKAKHMPYHVLYVLSSVTRSVPRIAWSAPGPLRCLIAHAAAVEA